LERQTRGNRLTAGDRTKALLLRWSPLLAFLLLALPLPAYFLLRYFTATENPGEWLLFAMTSFGLFSVFGLAAAFAVILYRKFWERRLRERLAADGVTADELSLFANELSAGQRRTLREMEARNPLLADAYRDALPARPLARRLVDRTVDEFLGRGHGIEEELDALLAARAGR